MIDLTPILYYFIAGCIAFSLVGIGYWIFSKVPDWVKGLFVLILLLYLGIGTLYHIFLRFIFFN